MIKPRKKKKAVSPVIATVLLISMVVVIALIIFLWFRSMVEDKITKFGDKNIKMVCNEVSFDASYTGNSLFLSNTGNVPIYGFKIKMVGDKSHSTKDIKEIVDENNWPTGGLNQGGTFSSGDISSDIDGSSEITVIPVLIGNSDEGRKSYTCDERNGYDIKII